MAPRYHLLPFILAEILDLNNSLLGKTQWDAKWLAPPKGNVVISNQPQSPYPSMLRSHSQGLILKTHFCKHETAYEQAGYCSLVSQSKILETT